MFRENHAGSGAGAWFEGDGCPRVRSCDFDGNVATGLGGALTADNGAEITVAVCAVHENVGGSGGGICISAAGGLITACQVRNNTGDFGGGVVLISASGARIEDTEFRENDANYSGGGIYASDAAFTIVGAAIVGNVSLGSGGGLWLLSSTGAIERTAIEENTAAISGDGMFVEGGAVHVGTSSIAGNGIGVTVSLYGSGSVDARWNWWGDSTGPHHPLLNPGGLGDEVSDRVLFDPWRATTGIDAEHDPVPATWGALKASYR